MSTFKLVGIGDKKILLLPGLMGTQNSFDAMLEFSDEDTFQYAVMEYRGYGKSRNAAGLFTLKEIVTDAVRIIDHLDWTEFSVVGHSVGALVAQMIAVALPKRVKSIVSLAGMNARGGSRDENRQRRIAEAAYDFEKRASIVTGGTGGRYTKAFATAVVDATWEEIAPPAFASYGKSATQIDIQGEIEGSSVPILVIVGEVDPGNTADVARDTTLRWYKNAVLEVFPRIGHYPMIEAPVATVSAIENFIAT